ncbi:MAG: chemoreceptor glutamine deamidase CheD [Gammaproteobacteria bacterium]
MTTANALSLPAEPGPPAKPLPGFEHIRRFWDKQHGSYAARLLPGEYFVTARDEMITTVLGSCISACIRDPVFGIGGMNHFMLPDGGAHDSWQDDHVSAATRYGSFAMEHLINTILKNGGRRDKLEIKIFGGGRVLAAMTDVGRRNIEFVHHYLRTEGLRVNAEDVGDVYPRKVIYFPARGRVLVKKLHSIDKAKLIQRETRYLRDLAQQPAAGEIELF